MNLLKLPKGSIIKGLVIYFDVLNCEKYFDALNYIIIQECQGHLKEDF